MTKRSIEAALPTFSRWLTTWLNKRPEAPSGLPLGISRQELEALRVLTAAPAWRHYLQVLERVAEIQASEFARGLPHDRYLYMCGVLHALHKVYALASELIQASTTLENLTDAHKRRTADHDTAVLSAFINTPWWDERANVQ